MATLIKKEAYLLMTLKGEFGEVDEISVSDVRVDERKASVPFLIIAIPTS